MIKNLVNQLKVCSTIVDDIELINTIYTNVLSTTNSSC